MNGPDHHEHARRAVFDALRAAPDGVKGLDDLAARLPGFDGATLEGALIGLTEDDAIGLLEGAFVTVGDYAPRRAAPREDASTAPSGDDDERAAIQAERDAPAENAMFDPAALEGAPRSLITPPTIGLLRPPLGALCRGFPGMFKRIPTGIAGLDKALGGGPTTSRLIVVGGAPGANKTGLLTRLAFDWASHGAMVNGEICGVLVAIFATDEPRHGFLSRMGQILGWSRADLDTENVTIAGPAWDSVASHVEGMPNLVIFDPRFEAATFEDVAEFLARHANGRRCALLVDSLQSAPFRCDLEANEGARLKMEARVKATVNLSVKHGLCVIATSELSRAGYRKGTNGQTEDLAAFKEASGIEYGADVGILMRAVEGESGNIADIVLVKNRLGPTETRVRVARESRFAYREIESPPMPNRTEAKEAAEAAQIEARAKQVQKIAARCPGIGKVDMRAALRPCKNTLADAAIVRARQLEWIEDRGKGVGCAYFACSPSVASDA